MSAVEIPLTEQFNDLSGRWVNYDGYTAAERTLINGQKHRDIRSFRPNETTPLTMTDLSLMTVATLNTFTMTQLATGTTTLRTENWTTGTLSAVNAQAQFPALALTSGGAGTVTTQSVMVDAPVDLLTDFADTDVISIALPSLPLASINAATTFMDLTSNATGNFTTGPTATIAFNASTVALVAGNSEFRLTRNWFNQNGINLANITGVRFRIQFTAAATLYIQALRLLATTWTHTNVDPDTRMERLERTPALNGDWTQQGTSMPIIWRSEVPSGLDDPRPIDTEFGTVFFSGAMTTGNTNEIRLYFREVALDFNTQLDLDTTLMDELSGHDQPDLGLAMWDNRTQSDLNVFGQDDLDGDTQFELERTPDDLSSSYIRAVLRWNPVSTTISFGTSETETSGAHPYTFTLPATLSPNSRYVFYVNVEETGMRAAIFNVGTDGRIGTEVYDTEIVNDDYRFKRRKGRFGWKASLLDGDVWIDAFAERRSVFAEYRSLPFESITPVVGAELFATHSPNIELFGDFFEGPFNDPLSVSVSRDTSRSTSGRSWKVENKGRTGLQGLQSNTFNIRDLYDSEISFDLFYPSDAFTPLKAILKSQDNGSQFDLFVPQSLTNQWQRVKLRLPFGDNALTGNYRLYLYQVSPSISTWWVDSATIFSRAVSWEGRAVVDNAWGDNEAYWTPFKDTHNRESGGVIFPQRGRNLQIRGRALRPTATIGRIQFKPKYAQLGNLRFPNGPHEVFQDIAIGAAGTSISSKTLRVRATEALPVMPEGSNSIVYWEWNFGDGTTAVGSQVVHTWPNAGDWDITLVGIDRFGNQVATTGTFTVA